jgi:hypothetical protein
VSLQNIPCNKPTGTARATGRMSNAVITSRLGAWKRNEYAYPKEERVTIAMGKFVGVCMFLFCELVNSHGAWCLGLGSILFVKK